MKHLCFTGLALGFVFSAAPVQAEDILSILARQSEAPTRLAPKTIAYSYTLTVDLKQSEGKDVTEGQAVLRIDPSQLPGARAQIISTSDAENEALIEFLKEIEDPDNTIEKQAEEFWCGDSEAESEGAADFISDLSNVSVIFEDETQAVLRPDMEKLADLLMESDENENKGDRKMAKKLLKRIEGDITLAKPSGEMKGFSVRMTRPMTIMLVAKLKVMTVEQSCALAPNGHYHTSTLQMNVEGKALGSKFGQEMDIRISDLTPLP